MKTNLYLTQSALIAAAYVVLCLVFRPISFSVFQVRIAEALTVLPIFTPAAVPGLAIGCLLGNFLGGAELFDVIFGTLATLLGAVGTRLLKKHAWLALLPPLVANTLIVPFILSYVYGATESIWFLMMSIFVGEAISCCALGGLLGRLLNPYKDKLFTSSDTRAHKQ